MLVRKSLGILHKQSFLSENMKSNKTETTQWPIRSMLAQSYSKDKIQQYFALLIKHCSSCKQQTTFLFEANFLWKFSSLHFHARRSCSLKTFVCVFAFFVALAGYYVLMDLDFYNDAMTLNGEFKWKCVTLCPSTKSSELNPLYELNRCARISRNINRIR